MAEITRILAMSTRKQFFFVITTAAITRCLVENFQLSCYSQRVNDVTIRRQWWFKFFKMAERSDGCSSETLLAPCAKKKKKLQRKDD